MDIKGSNVSKLHELPIYKTPISRNLIIKTKNCKNKEYTRTLYPNDRVWFRTCGWFNKQDFFYIWTGQEFKKVMEEK